MQQIGLGLLRAWDLIELCLKRGSAELVLSAFDVFAWSSSSFWISNKPLLEKCWKNAIDQNDWKKLYDVSIAEGWRDEDTLLVLEKSVVFRSQGGATDPNLKPMKAGLMKCCH